MWHNLPFGRATPWFRYGVPRLLGVPAPLPRAARGCAPAIPTARAAHTVHAARAPVHPCTPALLHSCTPMKIAPHRCAHPATAHGPLPRKEPGPGAWGERRRSPALGQSRRWGGVRRDVAHVEEIGDLGRAARSGRSELSCPEVFCPRFFCLKRRSRAIVRAPSCTRRTRAESRNHQALEAQRPHPRPSGGTPRARAPPAASPRRNGRDTARPSRHMDDDRRTTRTPGVAPPGDGHRTIVTQQPATTARRSRALRPGLSQQHLPTHRPQASAGRKPRLQARRDASDVSNVSNVANVQRPPARLAGTRPRPRAGRTVGRRPDRPVRAGYGAVVTPPPRNPCRGRASSVPAGRASRSGGCVPASDRAPCRPRSGCAHGRRRCRSAS